MTNSQSLDRYLPEQVRTYLEQTYYARVGDQSRLEAALADPNFHSTLIEHTALYSDHSVVHVRDVAQHVLHVLDSINGVLIPRRAPDRLENFMKSYGLAVTYLHDIGMTNFSASGRAMHPEFAAQLVFAPESDDFIDWLWTANCGGLADYLIDLHRQKVIALDPKIVLREMLSLSLGHSKSKVSVEFLNDPQALRQLVQTAIQTELNSLHSQQQAAKSQANMRPTSTSLPQPDESTVPNSLVLNANLKRFYQNFEKESYRWLISVHAAARELTADVIDTLRALRCADALRQRGSVLKTSAGYEIFIDQASAQAVYALRVDDAHLYLVAADHAIAVGEANIFASELDLAGNLRIAFQRGAFATAAITHYAAECAALIVNDIQSDVIESFRRRDTEAHPDLKPHHQIMILLEGPADNINFADQVRERFIQLNPARRNQIQIVPSLQHAAELECTRYLAAPELDWRLDRKQAVLQKVEASGHRIDHIDLTEGFQHVRLISLRSGETLLEADTPSSFVYVPLSAGLMIIPLGGYQPFAVQAWMPLGVTGVVRGAARNASIVAEQDVELLAIPKEVFVKHWYRPYSLSELITHLTQFR